MCQLKVLIEQIEYAKIGPRDCIVIIQLERLDIAVLRQLEIIFSKTEKEKQFGY